MGFIRANMLPILAECKRSPFQGELLLLGGPDIYFTKEHMERMTKLMNVTLNDSIPWKFSEHEYYAPKKYLEGLSLFTKLGFEHVSVMDVSAYENADILFDLNQSEPPAELHERFDVIIDHGTLEHIFHFPNAMNNLFQMLKVNGRVINSSPSNGFFDHGFYMLQPTLFADFYEANHWNIESLQIAQFTREQETEPPFFTDWEPHLFDAVSYGKMDEKLYTTICVATKTNNSTGTIIPQQGSYARRGNW